MHTTIVHVHVKEADISAFIKACRLNHEASIHEPGNRRFDFLQSTDDSTRFVFYEAYATAEHAAAHKKTAHYQGWRESVADMMAEPRRGDSYQGLFPADQV